MVMPKMLIPTKEVKLPRVTTRSIPKRERAVAAMIFSVSFSLRMATPKRIVQSGQR